MLFAIYLALILIIFFGIAQILLQSQDYLNNILTYGVSAIITTIITVSFNFLFTKLSNHKFDEEKKKVYDEIINFLKIIYPLLNEKSISNEKIQQIKNKHTLLFPEIFKFANSKVVIVYKQLISDILREETIFFEHDKKYIELLCSLIRCEFKFIIFDFNKDIYLSFFELAGNNISETFSMKLLKKDKKIKKNKIKKAIDKTIKKEIV
jgi:hypothetical protein